METGILEKILQDLAAIAGAPVISWHGGEPTVAGYGFFQYAMDVISKLRWNAPVTNQIQTNATLVTSELARLFKQNNFQVGISLDGTDAIHSKHRKDKSGKSTFSRVMNGLGILRSEGVDPWVIATVTRDNLEGAEEAFHFLVENSFTNIRFTPVFDVGDNVFGVTSKEWGDYLTTIFDLWFELGNPNIHIRELEQIMTWIIGIETKLCNGMSRCANWVSVDSNGDLYPCEYFKADYPYGNIKDISLGDIEQSDSYPSYYNLFTNPPEKCSSCDYKAYCGNGCPGTRVILNEMNPKGVDYYCESKKFVHDHIVSVFGKYL